MTETPARPIRFRIGVFCPRGEAPDGWWLVAPNATLTDRSGIAGRMRLSSWSRDPDAIWIEGPT